MNKAIIIGNLTQDPESRTTPSGVSCTTFRVAVQRRFANQQGVREADFINCVAWRQTADFVARYFGKGSRIVVEGSIQTRTYDAQDGTKRYVTEIVADNVEFGSTKGESSQRQSNFDAPPPDEAPMQNPRSNAQEMYGGAKPSGNTGFTEVEDDQLPF